MKHTPVYLEEALEALKVRSGAKYVDATYGQGGHFTEIAIRGAHVLGIDYDEQQLKHFDANMEDTKVVHGNFADIEAIAKEHGFMPAAGVLFDFGLSYGQLDSGGLGLSYKNHAEPLDMRLNKEAVKSAADILNTAAEEELYQIFAKWAEDVHARPLARACVNFRKEYKFAEVGDFIDVVDRTVGPNPQKSYARLFQALRIAVNDEIGNLKLGIAGALNILEPGGRMAIITFHSVEDRYVKQFIKANGEHIEESYKVIKKNSKKFERSALLRVIVKK